MKDKNLKKIEKQHVENKARGNKFAAVKTKRRSIFTRAAGVCVVFMLAVFTATFGINGMFGKNKILSNDVAEDVAYAATANQTAWENAIADSIANGTQETVRLTSDWIATVENETNSNTKLRHTYFGKVTSATGGQTNFPYTVRELLTGTAANQYNYSGALRVPAAADIVLDLAGHKLDRGLISNNLPMQQGGNCIHVYGKLKIIDSGKTGVITGSWTTTDIDTTLGNTTTGRGGAIFVSGPATLEVDGVKIDGNKTHSLGAAIRCAGFMTLKNSVISNNESLSSHYASVWVSTASTDPVVVDNCDFVDNNSRGNNVAGLGFAKAAEAVVTNCNFTGNQGAAHGGLYFATDCKVAKVEDCTFTDNHANNGKGGGVATNSPNLTLERCTITDNTATTVGAGINHSSNGNLTLIGCTIKDNVAGLGTSATAGGGGLYSDDGTGTLTITNTDFINNQALTTAHEATAAGAIKSGRATTILSGGTIKGNKGVQGGVAIINSSFDMTGTVITENVSTYVCGGYSVGGLMLYNNTKDTKSYIHSGSITKNAGNAGGLTLWSTSSKRTTLDFEDGHIDNNYSIGNYGTKSWTDNNSRFVGGVYAEGTFNFIGGTINNNNQGLLAYAESIGQPVPENALDPGITSTYYGVAGGMVVWGSLNMSGGEMSGNIGFGQHYNAVGGLGYRITTSGQAGEINLSGGKIINNVGGISGGIMKHISRNLNVSGHPVVKNNYVKTNPLDGKPITKDDIQCNVDLLIWKRYWDGSAVSWRTNTINVSDALDSGAEIGVTKFCNNYKNDANSYFTTNYHKYHAADRASDFFFSDNPDLFDIVERLDASNNAQAATFNKYDPLNWQDAVAASTGSNDQKVVTLYHDIKGETINGNKGIMSGNPFRTNDIANQLHFFKDYTTGFNTTYRSFEIPDKKSIKLDLNGHTIDKSLDEGVQYGFVIYMTGSGARFELCDSSASQTGTITGGWRSGETASGAGLHFTGGIFTMTGGTITGNSSGTGGGVYLSSVTMNFSGGVIENNEARVVEGKETTTGLGGGIYMVGSATLNMTGGIIRNNVAGTGAGIQMNVKTTTLKISGGEISGNTASFIGGGVNVSVLDTNVQMWGNPKITGNTQTSDDRVANGTTADDIHLPSATFASTVGVPSQCIQIPGAFNPVVPVGVYRDVGYEFTSGYTDFNSIGDVTKHFYAQRIRYSVAASTDGTEAALVSTNAGDNWYSAVINSRIFNKKQYTVTLTENWVAVRNTTADISRSLYGDETIDTSKADGPFYYGTAMIPDNTNIVLDLNGYTVDRGFGDAVGGLASSMVFWVKGNFTLCDNSKTRTGKVTGGFVSRPDSNNIIGGGVHLSSSGVFTMEGGTITGNKAYTVYKGVAGGVGGVGLNNANVRFILKGGSIVGNSGNYAGGVGFSNLKNLTFQIGGGSVPIIVENNTKGALGAADSTYVPSDIGGELSGKTLGNVTGYNGTIGASLAEIQQTDRYKFTVIGNLKGSRIGVSRDEVNNVTLANTNGNVFTAGFSSNNPGLDPTKVFFASDVSKSRVREYKPTATSVEASIWTTDPSKNWRDAHVANRNPDKDPPVTVQLEADWYPDENGLMGTGSGFSASGSLAMSQSYIILDLNGYTLDRGLGDGNEAITNGYVINMSAGRLEIIDSKGNGGKQGVIRGGNTATAGQAGGINLSTAAARLTLRGGKITENVGPDGGVATFQDGTTYKATNVFEMAGDAWVTGNLDTSNNPLNINLRAKYNQQIDIIGALTASGKSGVYRDSPSEFTYDFNRFNSSTTPSARFKADSSTAYVLDTADNEGSLYTRDNYTNWVNAVNESVALGKVRRTVYLVSNWTAENNYFAIESDRANNTAFVSGGALRLPDNSDIVLDLMGYKLDRAVSEPIDGDGYVIYVGAKSIFTLRDSSPGKTGVVTGGYCSADKDWAAGAVCVVGLFYMEGGTISGNRATVYKTGAAGAVNVRGTVTTARFIMTGGTITNNVGMFVGGVAVNSANAADPTKAQVVLGGSAKIYGNTRLDGTPSDVRAGGDTIANRISVGAAFNSDARIDVDYIGNNYGSLVDNSFTVNYSAYNPGKPVTDVFGCSNTAMYKVVPYTNLTTGAIEAAVECVDNEQNWRQAIGAASSITNRRVVKLTGPWTAAYHGTTTTAFGTSTNAYANGGLQVPAGKFITLDLNGYTINRDLTVAQALPNGYVFNILGDLEIIDTSASQKGTITGGSSNNSAGGIVMSGASAALALKGGRVTGNYGTVGGIHISHTAALPFSMGGNARVTANVDNLNEDSDIVADFPVQMIDIVSPLGRKDVKTGFRRPGIGDFTTGFATHMTGLDPADYFTSADPMFVETYHNGEAALYTDDNAMNWEYAIRASIAGAVGGVGKEITVKLVRDWTAEANTTGFSNGSTYTNAFEKNRGLAVAGGANIVLDLNGKKLDRNLTSTLGGLNCGYVIYVGSKGMLTVRDTSAGKTGVITGGHNNYNDTTYSAQSGAIRVDEGTFTLESGKIAGNRATGANSAAIVGWHASSNISILGGEITNNFGGPATTDDTGAGGIWIMTDKAVKMGGSAKVYGNKHNRNYDCDVRFNATGKYIEIVAQFARSAHIGVAPKSLVNNYSAANIKADGVQFTTNYSVHHLTGDDPSNYFFGSWNIAHSIHSTNNATTGIEGAFWCDENYTNWINAAAASSATSPREFVLTDHWTAAAHEKFLTSFHPSNTSYYSNGSIYLPKDKWVILDLNGYTIDRALFDGAGRENGQVFYLLGKLEIIDSSRLKSGVITGGNSITGGGGIVVGATGTLILNGGSVEGNIGTIGAGVYVMDGGKINIGNYGDVRHNETATGDNSNIYIAKASETIGITGFMNISNPIGVRRDSNGDVTTNFHVEMAGLDPTDYFESENDNFYGIPSGDGELFFLSSDNMTNWQYAVTQSKNSGGKMQTVRLTSDWTPDENYSFGTGTGFSNGMLNVPAGAFVELDLAGHTLDRSLTTLTERANGGVFLIGGKLRIKDTSDTAAGIIKGGSNSTSNTSIRSGCFTVYKNGALELLGGTIRDNKDNAANNASAIYVFAGGSLLMNDAKVIDNQSPNAGIYIETNALFNIGGAPVVDNNKSGGGDQRDVVFQSAASVMTLTSALTDGAKIGVYRVVNNFASSSFGGSKITDSYSLYHTQPANTYFFASNQPINGVIDYAVGTSTEAALYCYDNLTNWTNAVKLSNGNKQQYVVTLYDDWTAAGTTNDNLTAFGTDTTAFINGALKVPANANIILDLNSCELNRNLTTRSTTNGYVIYVEGTFTLTDSSLAGVGLVTGGWSTGADLATSSLASGVHVKNNATFTMTGGAVTDNKGVGVYLEGKNVFNLGGKSKITNNTFSGGTSTNLYLHQDTQMINVVSEFKPGAKFGVTRTKAATAIASGTLTKNFSVYNKNEDKGPETYFTSDITRYNIVGEGFFEDESMEAAILSQDNFTNWVHAVKTSIASGGKPQVCKLCDNWTASGESTYARPYTTAFTDVSITGFSRGSLYVPANCYVILDLNGYTIDRALTQATDYGEVIYVRGTLVIRDTSVSQNGTITGGYASATNKDYSGLAGGITTYPGATLIMEGGLVKGNKMLKGASNSTGGIYVSGGSTFTMTGGKVINNLGGKVGGVFVAADTSTLQVGGTPYIYDNKIIDANGAATTQQANVFLNNAKGAITVADVVKDGSKVGISLNASQVSVTGRNVTRGWKNNNDGYKADKVFLSDNTAKYIITDYNENDVHEANAYCRDNVLNWNNAVQTSINTKKQVTFVLYDDWIASPSGAATSFGTGVGFSAGGLYVPYDADIVLDLYGHTLDRNMLSATTPDSTGGYIICINGKLKVIDSTAHVDRSGNIIQGGFTGAYSTSGVIHQCYGTLTMEAGFVHDNRASDTAAGVWVHRQYPFYIGGTVQFKNNTNDARQQEDIVFSNTSNLIRISSTLIADADPTKNDIKIKRNKIGKFTTDWGKYNPETKPESRFVAQLSNYRVGSVGSGASREAAMLANNNKDNWVYAVKESISSKQAVRFTLIEDWTATAVSASYYNRSFGTDTTAYSNGALGIPYDANIVLDLNGHTLDRVHGLNYDEKYADYNSVIVVHGKLQIIDTSLTQTGKITGGSYGVSVRRGSGISYGGTLVMGGFDKPDDLYLTGDEANVYGKVGAGTITGNSVAGVDLWDGTATIKSGKITGNTTKSASDMLVRNKAKVAPTLNVGEDAYIYTPDRSAGAGCGIRFADSTARINITSKLSEDARIGYLRQGVGQLTEGWGLYQGNDTNPYDKILINEEPDKFHPGIGTFNGYTEATVSSFDNTVNWQFTVDKSISTGEPEEFLLNACWTADKDDQYVTSFGTGTAYLNGALYVPAGAKVIINLNGHKLNRNLTEGTNNGMVIYVDGELIIKDDKETPPDNLKVVCCDRPYGSIIGGANKTGSSAAGIVIGANGSVTLIGGTIENNKITSASSSAGAIYVSKGATFTMTGGSVSNNTGTAAGAFYIASGATVNIQGGEIKNNGSSAGGGAAYVCGTLNFSDGEMIGNHSVIGGVYVANGGKFYMSEEAAILNSEGSSAGGVFVSNGSGTLFKMSGGEISGNSAISAGGIYAAGTVEITGGTIKNNTATGSDLNDGGGALFISGTAKVTITGGEITNNSAANGIRVHTTGSLSVGGNARIYENKITSDPTSKEYEVEENDYCDIYFTVPSSLLKIASEFTDGAKIGIYRVKSGTFTTGYGMTNNQHPNQVFESNRTKYVVSKVTSDDVTATEAAIGIPVTKEPKELATPHVYNGNWQTIIEHVNDAEMFAVSLHTDVRATEADDDGFINIEAVNAGAYAISFRLKDGYCWLDGTTADKIVYAKLAPKPVTLDWRVETHKDSEGNIITDDDDNPVCIYDGTTHHGPVVVVADSCLENNVLKDGEKDTCNVKVSGTQIKASSGDGHTATATSVTNTNYTIGETTNKEFKFKVEKAERTEFDIATESTFFKTATQVEVTGDKEKATMHWSIDEASEAYASIDPDTGKLTINDLDATAIVTVVIDESENYKSATATKEISCKVGQLQAAIIPTEMIYGEKKTLTVEGYNRLEMGTITYSITNETGRVLQQGNEITATQVGTVKVTATTRDTAYYQATTLTATITIKPRTITIDWEDKLSTTYNGEEQTLAAPKYTGVLPADEDDFTINVYAAGKAGWANAAKPAAWTNAGTYDVGLVLSNSNYALENDSDTYAQFVIGKAKPTLGFEPVNAAFNTPFIPKVTGNEGNGKVTIKFVEGGTVGDKFKHNDKTNEYTPQALGTMLFSVTIAETTNYIGASKACVVTVGKAELPVYLLYDDLYYGGSAQLLTALYDDLNKRPQDITSLVTFSISTEDQSYATLEVDKDGNTYIKPLHAGKIKVNVKTSAAIGNYDPADVDIEVEIKPLKLQVKWSFDEGGYIYNGEVQMPTATLLDVPEGESCSFSGIKAYITNKDNKLEEVSPIDARTYKIIATFDNTDYVCDETSMTEFTIKPLPVELIWSNFTFVYNGEEQKPTAGVSNLCGDDSCDVKVLGVKNAGTNLTASAQSLSNSNYTLTDGLYTTCNFTITPKPVTVEWGETEFEYTGGSHVPKATAVGLVGTDKCDVTVSGAQINVGEDYLAEADGVTNNNYILDPDASHQTLFSIVAVEPEITLSKSETVYGDAFTLTVEGNKGGGIVTFSLGTGSENATLGTGNLFTAINVGKVEVIAKIAATKNYKEKEVKTIVTINPRPISVEWDDLEFEYDKEEHNASAKVKNTVFGDTVNVTLTSGHTDAGEYTASVTKIDNKKYTIVGGENTSYKYEIKKRVLTLTWSDTEFVYDGKTHAPSVELGNIIDGDTCEATVKGARDAGIRIEAYVESLSNSNYTVEGAENEKVRFNIAQRVALLQWGNTELQYTGEAQVPSATVSNLCTDDNGTLDECTVTVSGSETEVGTGYKATATSLSNSNYTLVYDESETDTSKIPEIEKTFSIGKAEITVELSTTTVVFGTDLTLALSKEPTGSTVTYTVTNDTGSATISGNVLMATGVGQVYVSVAVSESDNYKATSASNLVVTITPLVVTLEWEYATQYIYNGLVQTPTPTVTNEVSGYPCTVTSIDGSKDAGTYLQATAKALSNPNYTLEGATNVTVMYTISPLPITDIEWDEDRVYEFNGESQGPNATVTGTIGTDTCEAVVSGWKINAGDYEAEVTGLSNSNYSLDGIDEDKLKTTFKINVSTPTLVITTTEALIGKNTKIQVSGNVGDAELTFEILDGGDCATLKGDILTPKKLGTVKVKVTAASTPNTNSATAEGEISIIKGAAPLALTKTTVAYGSTLKLVPDDDDGNLRDDEGKLLFGTVTYSIERRFSELAVIEDGDVLRPLGVGKIRVKMSVGESDSFDATDKSIEIDITQRIVSLTWTGDTFEYNGFEQAPTATVSNIVGDDECIVTVKGAKNAGTHTATAVSLSNNNYTLERAVNVEKEFEITKHKLSLTWGDLEIPYNGKAQTPEAIIELVGNDTECDVNLQVEGTVEPINVGDYSCKTTGVTNPNYELDGVYTTNYKIIPADLNPTFSPSKITYGDTKVLGLDGNIDNSPYTIKILPYDSVGAGTLTVNSEGKYEFTATRVGTVKFEVEIIPSTPNCNYYKDTVELEVERVERVVELTTLKAVYGEDLELQISGNDDDPGKVTYTLSDSDTTVASIEGNVLKPKRKGVVTVTIRVATTENYKDEIPTIVQVVIDPRIVKLHWLQTEFIYNGKVQTPTAEVSNLVGDDTCDVTVSGGQINADTYTTAYASALSNPNYTLDGSKAGTIFTIGKKPIELEILTDRVNMGDPVTIEVSGNEGLPVKFTVQNYYGEAEITSDGKLNPIKTGSVKLTATVEGNDNYTGCVKDKVIIIDKSKLDVKLKKNTVEYGTDLILELEGNSDGSAVLYHVIDADGSAKIIGGDLLRPVQAGKVKVTVSIADSENYAATHAEFEVTITPLKVEITWLDKEFTYNGIDSFAPRAKVTKGLLPEDSDNCDVIVQGGQSQAGTYSKGTAYASGLTNPNYTLGAERIDAPQFTVLKADPAFTLKTDEITLGVPTELKLSGLKEEGLIFFMLAEQPEGDDRGEAELVDGVMTGTKLGYVKITVTVTATKNYNGGSADFDVLVAKAPAPIELENTVVDYGDTLDLNFINADPDPAEHGAIKSVTIEPVEDSTGSATLNSDGTVLTATGAGEVYVVVVVEATNNYKETTKKILVTINPIVVTIKWEDNSEIEYDGEEHAPHATVTNTIGTDECELDITGHINAGENLTAEITGTKNPNYTIEGAENLTTTFTIKPRVVTLSWEKEEYVYNGEVQTPKATVTNAVTRDGVLEQVKVTEYSGSKDAGEDLTAEATKLNNSNYTLVGASATTKYTILPYSVFIEWGDLHIPYTGSVAVPTATALGTFNDDVVVVQVSGLGVNVNDEDDPYTATATGLTGKDGGNYTLKFPEDAVPAMFSMRRMAVRSVSAEGVAGNQTVGYFIEPYKLTLKDLNLTKQYSGEPLNPDAGITLKNSADDCVLTFDGGDQTDVGEYDITLKLSGAQKNNYCLDSSVINQKFTITPKEITVKVTTIDKTETFTGDEIKISDWYTLSTDDFVGADVGKSIEDIFTNITLNLKPIFVYTNDKGEEVTTDVAGKRGTYQIMFSEDYTGSLGGSTNYTLGKLILDEEAIGELTVEGGDALKLAEGVSVDFINMAKEYDDEDVYYLRYSYVSQGMVHGKDDTDNDRVIIGNIMPETSVGDFLNNFVASQLNSIRIYSYNVEDQEYTLVYDCGKPAEGLTESDLYDVDCYSVGTGWKVTYGKNESAADTVYLSVLGDLNGDGLSEGEDISIMVRYILYGEELSMEALCSGLLANYGMITTADIAAITGYLMNTDDFSDYTV